MKPMYFVDINECLSNPCQNEGSCEDQINKYICRCPSTWEGSSCEKGMYIFSGADLQTIENGGCFPFRSLHGSMIPTKNT